jgi:hypothetical protein
MAAASLLRGVVTMRCDICTTTFARVPLLVSGAAQTCFDDQVKISTTVTLSNVAVYFDFGKIGNSIVHMSLVKELVTSEGLVFAYF